MSSATTSADYVGSAGLRAYAEWEQSSLTASQVTFRVYGAAQMIWYYLYGARVEVSVNQPEGTPRGSASNAGYLNTNPYGNWLPFAETDWAYVTFNRGGSDVTAYIRARASGENVPGAGGAFAGLGRMVDTGWQTLGTITIPKLAIPAAPTDISNVRDSDNKNTVSWTSVLTAGPYTSIILQRSVNGGAYSTLQTLSGATTSYADTATQANSSYAYRVCASNASGSSSYATSVTTYNTPAAPGTPTASRIDSATVKIDFSNPGITQTHTELQRSSNATSWTTASTPTGTSIASLNDIPGPGTLWYYRVRNTRSTLVSAWSDPSNAAVMIVEPDAPAPTSPASGTVISKALASIRLEWTHNPKDGSGQTSAKIRHSVNGGTSWSPEIITDSANQYYDLANSFAVNATVTWQVCTKGAHTNFGAWSSSMTFVVRQVPQATILTPASGSTLTDMPLLVTWSYSDQSGSQIEATLSLLTTNSEMVFRKSISGAGASISVNSFEFLPINGETYALKLDVRSSSSLTADTTSALSVSYIEPSTPTGEYSINETLGSAAIIAIASPTAGLPPTVSVGIFRKHADGRLVSLVDQVPSGTSYYDAYPPLDQAFEYLIVAYTASGLTSRLALPAKISSCGCAFFNFGSSYYDVAKISLNPDYSRTEEHTKEFYHTAGSNPAPLVFYGHGVSVEGSVTGTCMRTKEVPSSSIDDIDKLAAYRGYVVMRLPHEPARPVDVTVSHSFSKFGKISGVSIAWIRVRADGLAI